MDDSISATMLGRYRMVRRIGRGGMGEVWLAEDPRLQRQVALKVLPLRKRDDQEFLTRFEREARAAASLHHPHILPVHDYGQQQMPDEQTVTYLVMSYVSGGSVEDRLRAMAAGRTTLTQDDALAYLSQVAEAIDYAHAHGIIHRDIKPANMLLREDNWLLLTDFGIARMLTDADASTSTGAYLGTPTYMAPEQAQGQAVPASDIYSLAIVAYQFFTGRAPFQADNPYALTFQHAFTTATAPHVYNPSLSPEFEAALARGMAKDPTRRPLSATAFVTGLRQGLATPRHLADFSTVVSTQPMSHDVSALPTPRVKRRAVLIGVGAGVLLLGGGAAVYTLTSRARQEPTPPVSTPVTGKPGASATAASDAPIALTAVFTQAVTHMAWSPTKNVLVTANLDTNDEGQVTLWNMPASGQTPAQSAQHSFNNGDVTILPAWSPDGTKLALTNGGYSIGANQASSGSETLLYAGDLSAPVPGIPEKTMFSSGHFQGVAWLSNTSLATLEQSADFLSLVVKIWDLQHPQQQPTAVKIKQDPLLAASTLPNLLAAPPKSTMLAVGFAGGLQVGQVKGAGQQATWQALSPVLDLQNDPGVIGWSADGRFVAAVSGQGASAGNLGIWDATRNYAALQPAPDVTKLSSVPCALAWEPASRAHLLAVGGIGGQVALWDVGGSAAPQRILSGTIAGAVTSLAWSADGQWLAASYNDKASSILIWKV